MTQVPKSDLLRFEVTDKEVRLQTEGSTFAFLVTAALAMVIFAPFFLFALFRPGMWMVGKSVLDSHCLAKFSREQRRLKIGEDEFLVGEGTRLRLTDASGEQPLTTLSLVSGDGGVLANVLSVPEIYDAHAFRMVRRFCEAAGLPLELKS